MKKLSLYCLGYLVLFLLVPNIVIGTSFPNPDSVIFGEDIDGTGYFSAWNPVIVQDKFDSLTLNGVGRIDFGFYFQNNYLNTFELFGENDAIDDLAAINFLTYQIYDVETDEIGSFSGSGNIGFYITLIFSDPANGTLTLYSDANLNPLQTDVTGVFPYLYSPGSYLFTFQVPNNQGSYDILSVDIVQGLSPIPEPAGIFLFGLGLAALAGTQRLRCRKKERQLNDDR